MSAEILKKPSVVDLANATVLKDKRFVPGDNVIFKDYVGVVMKVIGYIQERVNVCWFNHDLVLVEAALPEGLLVIANEDDETEFAEVFNSKETKS